MIQLSKVIQELWILTDSGTVLFSRVFNDVVNKELFGGFITALNYMAEELNEGGLSNFESQKAKFTILKKEGILFVTNSPKKVKEKKIMSALGEIADQFITKYSEILKNWDQNTDHFHGFEENIQTSLQDPVKGFWSDF